MHPPSDIPLGDAYHQAEVGFGQPLFGVLIPLADPHGKLDLLLRGEERHPADFLQIDLDRIVERNAFERDFVLRLLLDGQLLHLQLVDGRLLFKIQVEDRRLNFQLVGVVGDNLRQLVDRVVLFLLRPCYFRLGRLRCLFIQDGVNILFQRLGRVFFLLLSHGVCPLFSFFVFPQDFFPIPPGRACPPPAEFVLLFLLPSRAGSRKARLWR